MRLASSAVFLVVVVAACATPPSAKSPLREALAQAPTSDVESAVSAYLATPAQSTDAMFDHLFAELPAQLRAQRAAARKYAAKSSGHH